MFANLICFKRTDLQLKSLHSVLLRISCCFLLLQPIKCIEIAYTIFLSVYLSFSLSISLSLTLTISLSLSLCLSLSLSHSIYLSLFPSPSASLSLSFSHYSYSYFLPIYHSGGGGIITSISFDYTAAFLALGTQQGGLQVTTVKDWTDVTVRQKR